MAFRDLPSQVAISSYVVSGEVGDASDAPNGLSSTTVHDLPSQRAFHGLPSQVSDVSDALDRLLSMLDSRAGTILFLEPNAFRTSHAYLELVCNALEQVMAA